MREKLEKFKIKENNNNQFTIRCTINAVLNTIFTQNESHYKNQPNAYLQKIALFTNTHDKFR